MPFQTGLPAALKRWGLTVETVPGWETRGSSAFTPKGALCHWTAGPAGSKTRPSLNICTNGRSDLPGPLCQVYLDRNGVAVVVAAGRANHAGAGNWKGLTGNSVLWGTEAEAANAADFTLAQRFSYPRINAAFATLSGFGWEMVAGHSEFALPRGRKVDINGYTMDQMRAQVAALLSGGVAVASLARTGGFLMALSDKQQQELYDKIMGRMSYVPHHHGDPDDLLGHVLSIRQNTETLLPGVEGKRLGGDTWTRVRDLAANDVKETGPTVSVDAATVARELAADPGFVEAIAEATAQVVAERLQS
jgi:hypothetical protein